jgi:hypothetical protein
MEAPKRSREIEIHGVLFKGTLPEKLREAIDAINTESQSFNLKDKGWKIGMIIYEKKEERKYSENQWNEIFPFIVSAPC